MAIQQININRAVSPDTKKLPPAKDIWESLERRLKRFAPSPQNRVSFDPPLVTVTVRDTIFWTNNDSVAHWPGLLNDDGTINPTFFIPNQIAPNGDVSASFGSGQPDPGQPDVSFKYECSLHRGQGEEGTITFTPAG
jgi:plastocyanin